MIRRAIVVLPFCVVALVSAQDGGSAQPAKRAGRAQYLANRLSAGSQLDSQLRPGVVRTGNISPIIENLDTSLAFYEKLLHLQVPPAPGGGARPFMVNPGLHKMFGTTGATERHVDARIPGSSMGIEMIE